jgi:hypothetical protein
VLVRVDPDHSVLDVDIGGQRMLPFSVTVSAARASSSRQIWVESGRLSSSQQRGARAPAAGPTVRIHDNPSRCQ